MHRRRFFFFFFQIHWVISHSFLKFIFLFLIFFYKGIELIDQKTSAVSYEEMPFKWITPRQQNSLRNGLIKSSFIAAPDWSVARRVAAFPGELLFPSVFGNLLSVISHQWRRWNARKQESVDLFDEEKEEFLHGSVASSSTQELNKHSRQQGKSVNN